MTTAFRNPQSAIRISLLILLLAFLATGCANRTYPPSQEVIPIASRDVAALDAEDIVNIMRRAGFTNPQILEFGPDLRNTLATAGTAKIRIGQKLEAIFAVDGPRLHVTSRRTGSFIYPLNPLSDPPHIPDTPAR